MERVAIGNDVGVSWRIVEAGPDGTSSPYDLTGKDLTVEIVTGLSRLGVTDFGVSGNLLTFTYYGKDQSRPGPVTFVVTENAGKPGMHRLDKACELEMVDSSSKAGGCSGCSHLELVTLKLYSVISVLEESAVPEAIARKAWVNERLSGYYTQSEADGRYLQSVDWGDVGGKPTTLAGFGITDAKIQDGSIILGESAIRPFTEHQDISHLATKAELEGKVPKEDGKGLSEEDYTTTEKQKLSGIAAGAQVNVLEVVQRNGADLPVSGKKVNIVVPTKTSDITNDSDFTTAAAVQAMLDIVNAKIPPQASADNQLADREFVNSSIATATAEFRGTFASVAALPAAGVDENDYAFVVATDAAGNTVYKRYKYGGSEWRFEYALNNSSFTAAQWAAIQSGMTAALREKLEALPTADALAEALAGKQAVIGDLEEIRSGAAAGKTAYQKPVAGIPKTDLAADVQASLGKADTALQQHQDISHLATKEALGEVDGRTTSLESSVEELLLGSHDHMAAAWAEEQLAAAAQKTVGDPSLVNFDFFLIDHNRNTDERSEPIGKLRRNNLLRFADGSFAPAVGITEAMHDECMGSDLYMDGELYAAAGAFDAEAFYNEHCRWEAGADGVVRLTHPTLLKVGADGDEVAHYLMPWETASRDYSFFLGHEHQLYYLQNVKGTNGRVWNFITTAPKTWDGLEPVAVKPSAFSPSPVAVITVDGKRVSRCAFYAYDGEAAVYGNGSVGDNGGVVKMHRGTGKTFPASSVMNQVTTMQYARNNNSDPARNYPFAEGGWALYNLFVTWLEIKYGTRALSSSGKFQSGISANDACSNETNWRNNGGVRCRVRGTEPWEYKGWAAASAIMKVNADGKAPNNWSAWYNNYHPKEACMESQMAASFAMEAGVPEGVEFEMYGCTYTWASVPGADNLEHGYMNAVIRSIRKGTVEAFDASGNPATFEVEVSLRMSLYEGANLSGDIYRYWGGGLEIIGDCISDVQPHSGDPVDIYFEPDQTKWVTDTEDIHNDGSPFVCEEHYEKIASGEVLLNGYSLSDIPMTPWQLKNGGGFAQGMCHYCYTNNYWSKIIGARCRIGVRFSGNAYIGSCAPRIVFANYSVGTTSTYYGGSAQVLIGESATALQAQ